MNSLKELFFEHNYYLRRYSTSIEDFLANEYEEFKADLQNVILSLKTEDETLSKMIEDSIDEMTNNSNTIIDILKLDREGKKQEAEDKAFALFEKMKPQLMYQYSYKGRKKHDYVRIRTYDDNESFPMERKELFHISYNEKWKAHAGRYSVANHPCLYLASHVGIAWYEMEKPPKFAVASFSLPNDEDNCFKFIDFSQQIDDMFGLLIAYNSEKYKEFIQEDILKLINIYPLRAACSVIAEDKSKKEIEEYIIPQLLLKWVSQDNDCDGIRYCSCSKDKHVREYGGFNTVLVIKDWDDDGYDKKLRKNVKLGKPSLIELCQLTSDICQLTCDGKPIYLVDSEKCLQTVLLCLTGDNPTYISKDHQTIN